MKQEEYVIEGVSVAMACVDAIPVLFFSGTCIAISLLFHSAFFMVGAILATLAGTSKVLWKLLLAVTKKNYFWLNRVFRPAMILGFFWMVVSVLVKIKEINFSAIGIAILGLPQVLFFAAGIIGMILMVVFARKNDARDAKANWVEQITNGIAQACFFIGVLLL